MKTNVKPLFMILGLMLISLVSQSQLPSWTSLDSREQSYPDSQYLKGFAFQVVGKNDNQQEIQNMLMNSAKTQLIESISISIRTEASLKTEVRDYKASEIFKQASTSTSRADLTGLKSLQYYDTKKKTAYAFVFVKIADLLESNKSALASESAQLAQKIEKGNQYTRSNDRENAIKTYYSCFPILREMEAQLSLMLALSNESSVDKYSELEDKVNRGISELKSSVHATLDEVCFFIADGLKQQLPQQYTGYAVFAGGFTFMNSRLGSEFSQRLLASLETKLSREGLTVLQSAASPGKSGSEILISGTYWPEGKNLKIIINLADPSTGKTLASIEDFLPLSWLTDQNIRFIPENLQSAITLQKDLSEGEIKNPGLNIRLWTSKGDENPIFKKNDKMQVYIQVNQACYFRLIYFFADGTKILLQNSIYIDEEKVNKPYIVPTTFVCDAPYGAEVLQLVTQTEEFAPLKTKLENGYEIIVESDKEVIAATRGMRKEKPALLMAEKRINVTTLEK